MEKWERAQEREHSDQKKGSTGSGSRRCGCELSGCAGLPSSKQ